MSTVLKPITALSDLAVGDIVVRQTERLTTPRRYKITALGRETVLMDTLNSPRTMEVGKSESVLRSTYKVERPEVLPDGLEYTSRDGQEFNFTDASGDTANVVVFDGWRGPSVGIKAAISTHFPVTVLRHLIERAENLTPPGGRPGSCA